MQSARPIFDTPVHARGREIERSRDNEQRRGNVQCPHRVASVTPYLEDAGAVRGIGRSVRTQERLELAEVVDLPVEERDSVVVGRDEGLRRELARHVQQVVHEGKAAPGERASVVWAPQFEIMVDVRKAFEEARVRRGEEGAPGGGEWRGE